jgi:uncharacterized protein YigE (DUF2233 family)
MRKVWPFLIGCSAALGWCFYQPPASDARFTSYVADPRGQRLAFFYQDDHGQRFGSIGRLRAWLGQHSKKLVFAMNGGMYVPGGRPKGLFIENGHLRVPLDTARGAGNFYLKPNGVFYLTTRGMVGISPTSRLRLSPEIAYATQSGPLLLVDSQPNPLFTKGSANVVVRNGVGVRPDGRVVFAISRVPVNFYDFATYFQRLGCRDALYLDGFVSRMYLPAQGWRQTDGDFGVIIAVTVPTRP